MPIIQLSQIVLRKGAAASLPGAPTSLNPLTFGKGLLAGELAFAEDTGQIFIGHSPLSGQPNFNRATFPYRNIEVLTENSTDTLTRVVGNTIRETGNESFFRASLEASNQDWKGVVVPRSGDDAYIFRLPFSDSVSAHLDYTIYDPDLRAIKMGRLSVNYFVGEAEPQVSDESTSMRRFGLLDPESYESASVFAHVDFKFIVDGPTGARYLSFQYKNHTDDVLSLRFKVTRPKA